MPDRRVQAREDRGLLRHTRSSRLLDDRAVPLAQAKTHRAVRKIEDPIEVGPFEELGAHGRDFSVRIEGRMIEAYRAVHGRLPPWNDVPGAALVEPMTEATKFTLEVLRGIEDDPGCARRTIQQLSADPSAMHYEESLHEIRQIATFAGQQFGRVFKDWPDEDELKTRILADGYLKLSALTEIPAP